MIDAPVMTTNNIRLKAAGASHRGLVRNNNEDHFLIEPELGLFLLADGMGGHQAGEVASRIAVEAISSLMHKFNLKGHLSPEFLLPKVTTAVHKSIRKFAELDDNLVGMGTTLVAAWWPEDAKTLWLLHVGDSRAYLLRKRSLQLLTEDHTYINEWRRSGEATAEMLELMPRNVLSQALGFSQEITPDLSHLDLQAGDRLLLCSDGLTDLISEADITTMLSRSGDPAAICENLIEAALKNGGRDNITVVVFEAV